MSKRAKEAAIGHRVNRLDIPIQQSYDDFIRRFEGAVPMLDRERAVGFVERQAPWSEIVADAAASAPHDFLLYWKLDLTPLMSLAGNRWRATEYLMGNHVIAETMYRHDPAVALYVPLRLAIYDSEEGTRFTIEQPSSTLSSLGQDEIRRVGIDLDRKLATLLSALNVEVPMALSQSSAVA